MFVFHPHNGPPTRVGQERELHNKALNTSISRNNHSAFSHSHFTHICTYQWKFYLEFWPVTTSFVALGFFTCVKCVRHTEPRFFVPFERLDVQFDFSVKLRRKARVETWGRTHAILAVLNRQTNVLTTLPLPSLHTIFISRPSQQNPTSVCVCHTGQDAKKEPGKIL